MLNFPTMILKNINAESDLNGNNVVEKIATKLQEVDPNVYQDWKDKDFDVNHLFGILKIILQIGSVSKITLLNLAAGSGYQNVVNALLSRGAEVNKEDDLGRTPLHCAPYGGTNRLEIMRYLLKQGANVNKRDNTGRTPLHYVWHEDTAKFLLDNGADPDIKNREGNTPYMVKEKVRSLLIKDKSKAMKIGGVCGVIAALAVGIGCGVAGVQLSTLAIVGIAVAAALAVGLVAYGITYAVSKPSYELENVDVQEQDKVPSLI